VGKCQILHFRENFRENFRYFRTFSQENFREKRKKISRKFRENAKTKIFVSTLIQGAHCQISGSRIANSLASGMLTPCLKVQSHKKVDEKNKIMKPEPYSDVSLASIPNISSRQEYTVSVIG
jgi:hypothetical protein